MDAGRAADGEKRLLAAVLAVPRGRAPAAGDGDIAAVRDEDVLFEAAGVDADLAALRRQAAHRLLDGKNVAEAVAPVADSDAAAGADFAERPETVAAVDRLARRRSVPGKERERRDEPPRAGRSRAVEERPGGDEGRRVGPGGYDPVIPGHARIAEGGGKPRLAELDRVADVHRVIDGVALAAARPD